MTVKTALTLWKESQVNLIAPSVNTTNFKAPPAVRLIAAPIFSYPDGIPTNSPAKNELIGVLIMMTCLNGRNDIWDSALNFVDSGFMGEFGKSH